MYISLQTITKLIGLSSYFQKETISNKLNKRQKKKKWPEQNVQSYIENDS